ncbi:MAG: hypothetical protein R2856_23315 [Caldilineaceae bacterium]
MAALPARRVVESVLRSHAEALARAWTLDGQGACNPLTRIGDDDPPCWHPFGDPGAGEDASSRPAAHLVYPLLCAICATFGSPYLASRLQIGDGYLAQRLRSAVAFSSRRCGHRPSPQGSRRWGQVRFRVPGSRPVRRADSPAQL